MKNRDGFVRFLKRKGKKEHVAKGLIAHCELFESYLKEQKDIDIDRASQDDIVMFAQELKKQEGDCKNTLRGLALYYTFQSREDLSQLASSLREQQISKTRKAFKLRDFWAVNPSNIARLEAIGIEDVDQMLAAGCTPQDRTVLAEKTGISPQAVLELVKLSDLSRIGGLKSIRARLYYEAGLDTLEKIAGYEPEELRAMLADFVKHTGFKGIPPLPKEVQNTVARAKELPKVVEYE